MTVTARHLATVRVPLGSSDRLEHLGVLCPPGGGRRLLVQRGDAEVAVLDLDAEGAPEIRIPAPWPSGYGTVTVSPTGDLAVFSGVHAVRAVDPTGAVRWELRHGCWSEAVCEAAHLSFDEYANDWHHAHASRASAAFSSDGKLVWAHICRGPDADHEEEWVVLDAAAGTLLGSARTGTVGSSFHTPHPDPARMGLTVGEGDEESPALWGHWDGRTLTFRRLDETVLLAASPDGRHVLATDPGQWSLSLLRAEDGGELRRAAGDCPRTADDDAVPPAPGEDQVWWGYQAAFPYDDAAVVGSEVHGEAAIPRHWLLDPSAMTVRGPVSYPFTVHGSPLGAGPGQWCTVSEDRSAIHLWALDGR
ncbi:hypothetical protein [Streptomyces sp. NPDC056600]|uniref:hypothetical protein n=1 Tax=Streptomyces sp. NPDC056600 TaxID=3345874 RepID=UPI0036A6FC95